MFNRLCRSVLLVLLGLGLLVRLTALADSFEDLLPVFVKLEFRDDNFARVDADRYGLAVGLLA